MEREPEEPDRVSKPYAHVAERFLAIPRDVARRLDELTAAVHDIAAFFPDLSLIDAQERDFMELMIRLDWPPPLEVSLTEVVELLKRERLDPDGVAASIDDWVMGHYGKDAVEHALETWRACPLCERRIPALEAAVNAHLRADFFCSVPVLLAQAEGLICDYYANSPHDTQNLKPKVGMLLQRDRAAGIGAHVDRAMLAYYRDIVHESLRPGTAPKGSLRRNLIMHGGDCSYGTIAMSYKSLLVFDFFVESLTVAVVDGEDEYHMLSCPKCRGGVDMKPECVQISNAATLAGRSPCKTCGPPWLPW
jgi:hypothetical protein